MMCAVVSVEFAISVGMADACVDPIGTMLRVMWTVAAGDADERTPAHLWSRNLGAYYVSGVQRINPLETSVAEVSAGLRLINSTVADLAACPDFDDSALMPRRTTSASAPGARAARACGGNGPIGGSSTRASRTPSAAREAAYGLVGVFFQSLCGLLLLILTLLRCILCTPTTSPMSCRRLLRTAAAALRALPRVSERSSEADADDPVVEPLVAAAVDPASSRSEMAAQREMTPSPARATASRASPPAAALAPGREPGAGPSASAPGRAAAVLDPVVLGLAQRRCFLTAAAPGQAARSSRLLQRPRSSRRPPPPCCRAAPC